MKEKVMSIYEKIKEEYSGEKAKELSVIISKFHRIQVSPWFTEAVKFCADFLKKIDVNFKIHRVPSDGRENYFTMKSFKKWNCRKGILYLEKPFRKKLADFEEMKLRVIPRSGSVKGVYSVVLYEGGKSKNIQNKVILTSKREFLKEEFLKENRIKGVVFYGLTELKNVRTKEDMMDALQYVSFWPEKDNKFFGFIISPREGEYLKKLLMENKKLRVYAEIDSEFEDGFIEIVDAWLKGEKEEEIWIIAHLCHPAPFVNDNASGVGCVLELVRCFRNLLKRESLRKPLRTIRFLLLPEMTGTYAYLKLREKELEKVKGGINLDMVGEDQEKCLSTFNLIKEPYGIMSYLSCISEIIFRWVGEDYQSFYGNDSIPSLRKKVSGYSGGSDHYILIDPTIGIPCVMLGQWPDKFYHTSFDNETKISEKSLRFAGTFAGTLAWYIANLRKEDIPVLKEKIKDLFGKYIHELRIDEEHKKKEKLLDMARGNALFSFNRLYPGIEKEKDAPEEKKKGEIPVRTFKAPLSFRTALKKMSKREREWLEKSINRKHFLRHIIELFFYYINGERTFSEIMDMIYMETGREEKEFLNKFYKLMKKYRFLKIKSH